MNKNSGYILATKTLRTNRIVRIINHKTHIKRTNNTLYKRLYECKRRGQLVAGQTGERPGAQRQTVRGGDGFGAEVLIKQHGQRRETATIARVDEEQHGQHGPQQSVADAVGEDLQQAHGNRHDEDYLIDGLAALQVVGECGEAHAASRVEHGVHGEHQSDDAGDGGGKLGGAQVGILREGPEHIVQDVLLLADEGRAAGDVDIEGYPDAPEHGLLEDCLAADV